MPPPTLEQPFRDFLTTGNEAALELWMRRSGPPLRQLGLRIGASAEDVDDLVQETFVAAIQGADRYGAGRPILPWLKGILTFRAARLARDEVRRRHHYEASSRDQQTSTPEPDHTHAELDGDVRRAIDDLPARYREPLAQYLLAQRSPVEIANALGVKRATVRVRLHRGLQRLRDALQRWGAMLLALLFGRRATAATIARIAAIVLVAVALAYGWPPQTANAHQPAPTSMPLATTRTAPRPLPLVARVAPTRTLASDPPAPAPLPGSHDQGQLTIRVHNALGEWLPNIGVTIEPAFARDPVLHRRAQVTREHGTVAWNDLAAGTWRLETDRGQQSSITILPGSQSHTFTVANTDRTYGIVVDTDGVPVANAGVWLSGGSDGPWRGQEIAHSDEQGRFELRGVPAGAFLASRHERLSRSEPYRLPEDGSKEQLTLRLGPPGGCVAVRITDGDGNAISGAAVHVGDAMDAAPLWLAQGAAPWRAPPFAGRTESNGQFHTHALEPGDHSVFVRARGYAPYRALLHVEATRRTEHVAVLRPGAHIAGSVCDPHGNAIANALVIFRHDDSSASIDAITDEHGSFQFECLPTGTGDVLAKAPGFTAVQTTLSLGTARHACRMVLSNAFAHTGSLLIAGRPAARGTQVRATWPPSATRDSVAVAPVDRHGRFAFPNAAGTPPMLRIRLAGEPMWRDVDAFTEWRERDATIRVREDFLANSWISGRCTSDDNQPLQNARMFVCCNGKRWSEVGRTDHNGNYRLGPLAAASYRVFAESTQTTAPTLVAAPIALGANAHERVDLTAPTTGEVDILLERDDGKQISDVLMTLHRVDLHRRFAIANRPHLRQRLAAGEYVLAIMGSSVQWVDEHRFTVQPGAVTPVQLTLRAASNCTLILKGFPQRSVSGVTTIQMRSVTDPQWRPTVSLLPDAPLRIGAVLAPGSYSLEHVAPDGSRWRGCFAVASPQEGATPLRVTMHCTNPTPAGSTR